jgi:hypothetical protein
LNSERFQVRRSNTLRNMRHAAETQREEAVSDTIEAERRRRPAE